MAAVHHIGFNCADRRREEAFLTEHLGFKRCRVFNPGADNEFVMLRLGGTCVELFDAPAGANKPAPQPALGFVHLAFEVGDLDGKVGELKKAGCSVGDIIDCSSITPGMRVCFFEDPEGNTLELMEQWADEDNPTAAPEIREQP
jgi:glyoxylase I family protein